MSLYDRPSLAELIEAVREYITDEVAPAAADRRARFRALIAANVLAIAERELHQRESTAQSEAESLRSLGLPDASADEMRAELARRIRAGDYDDADARAAALAYARAAVRAKLAVSNPKFLKAYES